MTAAGADAPDPELVARLATIGQRFLARLVDGLVIGIPIGVLVGLTSDFEEVEGMIRRPPWAEVLSIAAAAVYEVVLIRMRGQTVGKRALHIKVVRLTDGHLPDWTASIMRYLLPVLPTLVPLPWVSFLYPVVYLVAIFHPLRQGWHDRAAGTVVVKVDADVDADTVPDQPPPPPPQ